MIRPPLIRANFAHQISRDTPRAGYTELRSGNKLIFSGNAFYADRAPAATVLVERTDGDNKAERIALVPTTASLRPIWCVSSASCNTKLASWEWITEEPLSASAEQFMFSSFNPDTGRAFLLAGSK